MKYLYYHITCTVTNIIIYFIAAKLCVFTIEYIYQDVYFTKKGSYLMKLYAFSIIFLSWFSTFLIYIYKKYKNHYFLLIIILLLYSIIYYFVRNDIGMRIDFIQETFPFIIIVSLVINFTQMTIGKKLLPTMYQK